jgi:hypothetical protein
VSILGGNEQIASCPRFYNAEERAIGKLGMLGWPVCCLEKREICYPSGNSSCVEFFRYYCLRVILKFQACMLVISHVDRCNMLSRNREILKY